MQLIYIKGQTVFKIFLGIRLGEKKLIKIQITKEKSMGVNLHPLTKSILEKANKHTHTNGEEKLWRSIYYKISDSLFLFLGGRIA